MKEEQAEGMQSTGDTLMKEEHNTINNEFKVPYPMNPINPMNVQKDQKTTNQNFFSFSEKVNSTLSSNTNMADVNEENGFNYSF